MATWIEPFLTSDIPKNRSFPPYTTQFTVRKHPKFLTSPSRDVLCSFKQICICISPLFTQMAFTQLTVL